MKALLSILLFSSLTLWGQEPAIVFKVINGQGETVRVTPPLNGKYFLATTKTDTLDANGELIFPNREAQPGAYEFFYKRLYRLYVYPGEEYSFIIDPDNETTPIQIRGRDKDGQLALNNLNLEFYQTVGMRYYREDSVFAHTKPKILTRIEQELTPFRTLLEAQKIGSAFYQYSESLITTYYANVLACSLIRPMMQLEFNKDSAGYDRRKIDALARDWHTVLSVSDVYDPASMQTSAYLYYANFFQDWYLRYFLPGSTGNYTVPDEKEGYEMVSRNFRDSTAEHLTATLIYFTAMQRRYESFIPDWYHAFANQYPHSNYTPMLTAEVERVKTFHAKVGRDFSPEQRFVDQADTISKFDQLTARFKGKTMYMDLWATWCGPCKAEFAYNDSLKLFFKKSGVEALYISLDKEEAEQQWKNMIKYYDLQGYHIRVSPALMDDIRSIFGTKSGALTIPRYAIIKDGKIIVDNAKRPSAKQDLYKQIEALL